jgi:hypothetical protein
VSDLSTTLNRINVAALTADDLDAYTHAREVLKSARHASVDSGDLRQKLRVLTRFVSGAWSAIQTGTRLGWDEQRVREEAIDWAGTPPFGEPLSACWIGPAKHPGIAEARKVAEGEADKRDLLRGRLILRLKVAAGVLDEKAAAQQARLSLAEWQLFCASEDAAPASKDREYREGWILNMEGESNAQRDED